MILWKTTLIIRLLLLMRYWWSKRLRVMKSEWLKTCLSSSRVMLANLLTLAMVSILLIMPMTQTSAETYYLGVLAPQGEVTAQQRWQPWLSELNKKLKDDTVILVPLALENWQQQIDAQKFAFVLGPQIQFIKMDTIGWRWLATLQANTLPNNDEFKISDVKQADFKTDEQYKLYKRLVNESVRVQQAIADNFNQPNAMEQIASVLWVKTDSDIQQLQDIKHRKVVAVDPNAFAGYLLIAHLLQQNGVTPSDYTTQFVGYPIELTLSTLASGAVDAAIAPLCLMEEMARQGKIDLSQYRVMNPVTTDSNCQSSTKIYPNWTLAATRQAPPALIEQVNQHLFVTSHQDGSNGLDEVTSNNNLDFSNNNFDLRWLAPESNSDAERILYAMRQHPEQKPLGAHLWDWIKSHRLWVSLIFFIVTISTINYAWMSWLAWRRRQQILKQNQLIRDYDYQLQQSERFAVIGEMSGAIAHEINQPLATIQNYAQGLLIRSQNNRIDKDSTESALTQIITETERVAAVINNIRRWAGRSQPTDINVNIADTYQQCVLLLSEKVSGMSFWFASKCSQLRLPNLMLDQLLVNSMLNAQQQGASQFLFRCQIVKVDGAHWLGLFVTDDAGGFSEIHLADSKSQNQHSQYSLRSTKAEGLGLGLMICQRLCKSLGGFMQLSNVDVATERSHVQAINGHRHQRIKRLLNGKVQLMGTEGTFSAKNKTGAQVGFYLPLALIVDIADDTQYSLNHATNSK